VKNVKQFVQRSRTEIGKARAECAQSFALWQQATVQILRRGHSIIACSRHIYTLLFLAHIPFVVNHTINATPTERLQQQNTFKDVMCNCFTATVGVRVARYFPLLMDKIIIKNRQNGCVLKNLWPKL